MSFATTVLRSRAKRLRIRPDRPAVIIGERCNTLGYRSMRSAVERGDFDFVAEQAVRQVEAGADIINVNMVGLDRPERELLPLAVRAIAAAVDVPLSLDFGDPEALKAALPLIEGTALINSVSGEEEKLKAVLPLMKEYGAAAIAMTCDDDGIPYSAQGRLAWRRKIVERAAAMGIEPERFIFDCIAMGIGTDETAGRVTFETMRLVRSEFGANITLGASNISFGLPKRRTLDAAYLAAAITHGLNCPITDPTNPQLKWSILAADAITGSDPLGIRFIKAYRAEEAERQKAAGTHGGPGAQGGPGEGAALGPQNGEQGRLGAREGAGAPPAGEAPASGGAQQSPGSSGAAGSGV